MWKNLSRLKICLVSSRACNPELVNRGLLYPRLISANAETAVKRAGVRLAQPFPETLILRNKDSVLFVSTETNFEDVVNDSNINKYLCSILLLIQRLR